jgi:hypothetical protein
MLNFATLTFGSGEAARSIASQLHRVPLTKRASFDYPTLSEEVPPHERRAGLEDVAALVGINPATLHFRSTGTGVGRIMNDKGNIGDASHDDDLTYIEVKAERQKNREQSDGFK